MKKPWLSFRELLIPIAYACFYFPTFFWLNKTTRARFYIHCILDDYIPFCEWFVFPYLAWFLLIPAALLLCLKLDRTRYRDLCFVLFAGMTVCLCIYKIFPNGLVLRTPLAGESLAVDLVHLIRHADAPTNVCPSIHVSSTVAIGAALWNCNKFRNQHPMLRVELLVLCALICVSTLFLKQHSVVDVCCGVLLTVSLNGVLWLRRRAPEWWEQRRRKKMRRLSRP